MSTPAEPSATQRTLHRIVGRSDRWGYLTTTVSRYGSASSTIVIYPPGTPAEERRLLRIAHAWPALGLLLLAGCAALMLLGVDAAAIAVASSVLYIGAGLSLAQRTARTRHGSARASVSVSLLFSDKTDTEDFDTLASVAAALRRTDTNLDDGLLTPIEHELVWTAAHQAVGAIQATKRRDHQRAPR